MATLAQSDGRSTMEPRSPPQSNAEKLFNRICAGVLIAFALLWLIPLLWAVDTALKPNAETTRTTWLIDIPTFDAFTRTLRDTDMWSWYGACSSSPASPRSAP